MTDAQTRLNKAKAAVDAAKTAKIRLEAQLEQVESRRSEVLGQLAERGIDSEEAARARIAELEAELETELANVERKLA